jgi:penicillin amidase
MMILIYQEENSPSNAKYKTPTGFSNYLIRKNIKVKDSADVLNVKVSRHGPIMNNFNSYF